MDRLDLIDRLVPSPAQTLVIETPKGELVLVCKDRLPKVGDTVLADDTFMPYQAGLAVSGVAYAVINFL